METKKILERLDRIEATLKVDNRSLRFFQEIAPHRFRDEDGKEIDEADLDNIPGILFLTYSYTLPKREGK